MENAGFDVDLIKEEWGDEFRELDCAPDWTPLGDPVFERESRWCLHWTKYIRHDGGLVIGIEYATDAGDGESSVTFPDTWFEAEAFEVTETRYRKKGSGS